MNKRENQKDLLTRLSTLRDEIDRIDDELIARIVERATLARETATLKEAAGLPLVDPPREVAVIYRALVRAQRAGLSGSGVREVFAHLIGISRQVQTRDRGLLESSGRASIAT